MAVNPLTKLAFSVANYLSNFQTEKGLKDPLENRILRSCYGNSFYSLLCALVFKKTKKKIWKERAIASLKSELKNIKQRNSLKALFRWEFKNYALIKIYALLKNELDEKLKKQLVKAIKSWKNLYSFQTNWATMRALNYLLRYDEFGNPLDLLKSKFNLGLVLKRQDKEGFFPDDLGSYCSQYHAYTLALLYQYYELTNNEKVKKAFVKGVDFIINYVTSEGDFNYFGRGKKQIFGYASMIFALYGAAKITTDLHYAKIAEKVFSYVSKFVNKKDNYPIVLEKGELYEYNYKSDYLPFFSFYLLASPSVNAKLLKQYKTVKLVNKSERELPRKKISCSRYFAYYFRKSVHVAIPYFFKLIFSPRDFLVAFKYRSKHH